jgi:hypothetical protein
VRSARLHTSYLNYTNTVLKVLEYTLFQPGLFLDYLASPHRTSKYVTPLDTFINFQNRRAIVVEGHEDAIMALTSVHDIAGVVAKAVDLEVKWPENGGIQGNRLTVSEIIKIGEKVRGTYIPEPKNENEELTDLHRRSIHRRESQIGRS